MALESLFPHRAALLECKSRIGVRHFALSGDAEKRLTVSVVAGDLQQNGGGVW